MMSLCINLRKLLAQIISVQFIKKKSHYRKDITVYCDRLHAKTVVNQIKIDNLTFLFNCTPTGRTSESMMVPT